MSSYRALVVDHLVSDASAPLRIHAEIRELSERELEPGEVRVAVEYSSINYKDGLAITGKPGVIRHYPLTAGIDLAGTIAESRDERFRVGEQVLANGWGLGEKHPGGLAEQAVLRGDWLTRVPAGLNTWQAAAIGTAGFTAALSVLAIEADAVGAFTANGTPDVGELPTGEVLVTGASGGVGSIAIMLAARGPNAAQRPVIAATGRAEHEAYLRRLGASGIIPRSELSRGAKPLESERWVAAIESVGGQTLATVLAQTRYGGTVTSCGLAESTELPATVMPFILRGVRLQGINSVLAPTPLRDRAWALLAGRLPLDLLEEASSTLPLAEALTAAEQILLGRIRGRTVIDVRH